MSVDLSNVITVSLQAGGALVSRDNFNLVAVFTSQQSGPLSTANRTEEYRQEPSVSSAFGTASSAAGHANAFFGTQPNPVNAGGSLLMSYWRGASESVAATAAVLTGAQISPATVVSQLQAITDGALNVTIDAVAESLTALDFQSITSVEEAVAVIDAAVTGGVVTYEDQRIIFTSSTTGVLSLITFAADPGTGTFIGEILLLASGTGATTVQGVAAEVLTIETKLDALAAVKAEIDFKGFVFIDPPTDQEAQDIAAWCQANGVLSYDVFDTAANLDIDPANPVWAIKLAGLTNYRMQYSKTGNRKMATSYMARAHTVNFGGENTALTMNLKALAVPAEDYTQTEITAAETVGLDIYTTFKTTPKTITSGANGWADERYNLLAFTNAVQTDLFNLLGGTATKIPQTLRGVNQEIDQVEKTSRQFVRAGVFAPGTWSSPDYFGDRETFERNILDNGFYVLAASLADQEQAEREGRISPVLQLAVKSAGAIHKANIIINFNA